MEDTDGGDRIVSAINMLDFAERSALDTGVLDLGLRAGAVPIAGYGVFGQHVVAAPTLHGAIRRFCTTVRSECSEADYFLTIDGPVARFNHGPVVSTPVQQQQHELYALMIMAQVIRLALGADWQPRRVRLQTLIKTDLADNDFLGGVNVEFGAPVTSVEFPAASLALPLTCKPGTRIPASRGTSNKPTFDPMLALENAIADQIRRLEKPGIEQAAAAVGVSKRSLQRFLKARATTYTGLLDQVRFNLALPLLNDDSASVTDIAYRLGYANVAHFSRAFNRITGMSPRAYRKTLNQG